MRKADQEKLRENRFGAGERRSSGACKHCFSIPHSCLAAPGITYDWSVVTVISITACMVL